MKNLFCFIVLWLNVSLCLQSQNVCSGLDGVDVYRNSKRIATWTQAEILTIQPNLLKSDTFLFHVWTSLESLKNATIDVKDSTGQIVAHIYGHNNTGYEADFNYIFDNTLFDDLKLKSLEVFFNLVCDRDIHPQQIAAIVKRGIK